MTNSLLINDIYFQGGNCIIDYMKEYSDLKSYFQYCGGSALISHLCTTSYHCCGCIFPEQIGKILIMLWAEDGIPVVDK